MNCTLTLKGIFGSKDKSKSIYPVSIKQAILIFIDPGPFTA